MPARQLLRSGLVTISTITALAAVPASALGDTTTSSNWSGYAAHGTGQTFRRVSASWVQPAVTCQSGQSTYSSFWVGIGGYNDNASGLEQIGTSLDCADSGQHYSTAWYELVPAPARPINMTVRRGDRLTASVTVVGQLVTLHLRDRTRDESFSRRLTTQSIDVTSAEWIAEAPSACNDAGFCQGLPLANFGTANFTNGIAETVGGQAGAISSPAWDHTRILLSQGSSPFMGLNTTRSATPSALERGGTAFAVRYGQSQAAGSRPARAAAVSSPGVLQPGGPRR
jgi:peptidase A4-like protein